MKKIDFEKLLMDPEGIKIISERARSIKEKYGTSESVRGEPAMRHKITDVMPHDVRPTVEEADLNDRDYFVRGNMQAKVGHLIPDEVLTEIGRGKKVDPSELLVKLIERCKKDPSLANQLLIEDAINSVIAAGVPEVKFEKHIEEAIDLLGKSKGAGDIDSVWGRFYQHSGYQGWSYFLNHGPGYVYRLVPWIGNSYNDSISSLYVGCSATDRGEMIIFENKYFRGRYSRFSGTPGSTIFTNYIGGFMNDRTSSILAVRRFNPEKEFVISLGSLGLRSQIAEYAASVPRISLRGNPIITWDMWPPFSPSKRFIYLRIPVTVDVPNWWDYDAEIRYWIYLYVSSAGQLNAYVAYYGCWVESGIKSGSIADRIMDELPSTVGAVNSQLSSTLALVAPLLGPLERQYFLPGTAALTGHTEDDVTLVLVKR